jgi:LemA protein
MELGLVLFILLGFGLATFVAIAVGVYNALVTVKENVLKAWANIDVILKQRYDEIPQLIEICEQYVEYEADMIKKIMAARENMVRGKSVEAKAQASQELTEMVGGLLAIGENYPNLKANEHFLQIQKRLSDLEESLADRREFYNDSVNIYNIRIQQIPDVIFARMLGYERKEMFEVHEPEKARPSLKMKKTV